MASRRYRLLLPVLVGGYALLLWSACALQSPEQRLRDLARTGNLAEVKELIAKGAKVDEPDEKGYTALREAVNWGRVDMAKMLIDAGANPRRKDEYGNTLLMDTAWWGANFSRDGKSIFGDGDYASTFKLLIASGVDVNAENSSGQTALTKLLDTGIGNSEVKNQAAIASLMKVLLEAGADPRRGKYNASAMATMHHSADVLRILLDSGRAEVNSRSLNDDTPLMLALEYKRTDNAELLITRGAQVNVRNKDGITPLMLAVKNGDIASAEMLIKRGADASQKDSAGRTALHQAISQGQADMVKTLLANGADPNVPDAGGMTPLKIAEWAGRDEISQLLRSSGAK